jgi:hypothetical protein
MLIIIISYPFSVLLLDWNTANNILCSLIFIVEIIDPLCITKLNPLTNLEFGFDISEYE